MSVDAVASRVIARLSALAPNRAQAERMARTARLTAFRLACLGLLALVLAGCANNAGYYDQPAARRCDRNGDIDERRACS